MDSDKVGQGTQAERLTQLADLHRQGVLSDKEYETAAARVVGVKSDVPGDATPEQSPAVSNVEASTGVSGVLPHPNGSEKKATKKVLTLVVVGVVAMVLVFGFLVSRGSASGDQKACDLFHQATARPVASASFIDQMGEAAHAAEDPDLHDALEHVFLGINSDAEFAAYRPTVEALCSSLG
jgi:hypothetical protein